MKHLIKSAGIFLLTTLLAGALTCQASEDCAGEGENTGTCDTTTCIEEGSGTQTQSPDDNNSSCSFAVLGELIPLVFGANPAVPGGPIPYVEWQSGVALTFMASKSVETQSLPWAATDPSWAGATQQGTETESFREFADLTVSPAVSTVSCSGGGQIASYRVGGYNATFAPTSGPPHISTNVSTQGPGGMMNVVMTATTTVLGTPIASASDNAWVAAGGTTTLAVYAIPLVGTTTLSTGFVTPGGSSFAGPTFTY